MRYAQTFFTHFYCLLAVLSSSRIAINSRISIVFGILFPGSWPCSFSQDAYATCRAGVARSSSRCRQRAAQGAKGGCCDWRRNQYQFWHSGSSIDSADVPHVWRKLTADPGFPLREWTLLPYSSSIRCCEPTDTIGRALSNGWYWSRRRRGRRRFGETCKECIAGTFSGHG